MPSTLSIPEEALMPDTIPPESWRINTGQGLFKVRHWIVLPHADRALQPHQPLYAIRKAASTVGVGATWRAGRRWHRYK